MVTALISPWRRLSARWQCRKLRRGIESGLLDSFLETLLRLMRLTFAVRRDYRRNIDGFEGRYAFRSRDGAIACSAIFSGGHMRVRNQAIGDTDVTVVFRDGRALMNFLFAKDPDIIGAILDNEVTYEGNLNYLAKFAYMARRLQLMFAL